MLDSAKAFSSFAVDDLEAAKTFYVDTLGMEASGNGEMPLLGLKSGSGSDVMVYEKPDFAPASYTVLNFPVDDIDQAVDELAEKGVVFESYDDFEQDEKGIFRGQGPNIAWFKDPAGNILAVLQED